MPPPFADKFASNDLSDDEALSPTDGYFHSSSLDSRRVFVEVPTAGSSSCVKARGVDIEASTDTKYHPSRQHYTTAHSQQSSPSSSLHTSRTSHPRDVPPPAYTPSPPAATSPRTGYQTFGPSNSTMGLPVEQQRLVPRSPESMGDNPGFPQEPSRWQQFVDCLELKKRFKKSLGVIIALFVIAVLVTSFSGRYKDKSPPLNHGNTSPKQPPMDPTNNLTWKPRPGCRNTNLVHATESFATPWTPERSLNIVQDIARHSPGHGHSRAPHVYGEIVLRPVDEAAEARVDVQVITNDEAIEVEIVAGRDNQDVKVIVPNHIHWNDPRQGPCVQMSITISAPRDATLSELSISSVQLDTIIKKALSVNLDSPLRISSVSGSISTPRLSPSAGISSPAYTIGALGGRSIHMTTVSGSITGWFPLLDALYARTVSGDVDMCVTPQAQRPECPTCDSLASLQVYSESGSLLVDEGIMEKAVRDAVPQRDYHVDMVTRSGDLVARVASSTKANMNTRSGDMDITLYPIAPPDSNPPGTNPKQPMHLSTETVSGDSRIRVLDALGDCNLRSSHVSVSGDLQVRYADWWEGRIVVSGVTADLSVRGRDVVVDERTNGPGGRANVVDSGMRVSVEGRGDLVVEGVRRRWLREIKAHKGDSRERLITASSVSGDVDVLVGEE